jgi:predicted PurR-regulated permease PerM
MKFFKPFILALIIATLDYSYRSFRHLNPDIWFFAISFTVFFTIIYALFNYQKE